MPKHDAESALRKLVELGCDATELRTLLHGLEPAQAIQYRSVEHGTDYETGEPVDIVRTQVIPLRRGDLQWGNTPDESFDFDDLHNIERLAARLQSEIERLQRTPLVGRLLASGEIREGDLLYPSSPVLSGRKFRGLLNLASMAANVTKHAMTMEQENALIRLCVYVKDKTGDWQGALVGDIIPAERLERLFNAVNPYEAFRKWRFRQKLVDRKSKSVPSEAKKKGS